MFRSDTFYHMNKNILFVSVGVLSGLACSVAIAFAWTAPPSSAPGSNVSAPINVGSISQSKNGVLGVNGLGVFGNELISAGNYLNFGLTSGSSGYGIRDNAGTLEFKNQSGTGTAWASLNATIQNYLTLNGTSPILASNTHTFGSLGAYSDSVTLTQPGMLTFSCSAQATYSGSSGTHHAAGIDAFANVDGVFCATKQSIYPDTSNITFYAAATCVSQLAAGTHTITCDAENALSSLGNYSYVAPIGVIMNWYVVRM